MAQEHFPKKRGTFREDITFSMLETYYPIATWVPLGLSVLEYESFATRVAYALKTSKDINEASEKALNFMQLYKKPAIQKIMLKIGARPIVGLAKRCRDFKLVAITTPNNRYAIDQYNTRARVYTLYPKELKHDK